MKRVKIRKGLYIYKGTTEERWVAEWRDLKGKRREKWFQNRRHAEDFARRTDRDIDEGIHVADRDSITFGKALRAWLEHCEKRHKLGDLAGNTLKNYQWSLVHILPEFDRKPLNRITSRDVEKWVFKLMDKEHLPKPLARHSVHNAYTYVLLILDHAVKNKWLRRNPLKDDPIHIPGKKKKRTDIPPSEDIEKLIAYFSGAKPGNATFLGWANDKIAFYLCAFAGVRAGEASALKWENIDLQGARFHVIDDEGSNSAVDGLKSPKTEAGVRTITICQCLYDALLDHAHATDSREGFVIKNAKHPDSPRPPDVGKITDLHRQMMRDVGLVKSNGRTIKFTTHALRHWYISMCLRLGINPMNVSKRVGHSQPSMTLDIYGHVLDGDEDGLKEQVEPIWQARFTRANPNQARIIDATAFGSKLIDLDPSQVVHEDYRLPPTSMPWVPEALRLLEGGWRVSDVSRHLGQTNSTIFRAFHKAGLPPPRTFMVAARGRVFEKLHDEGYSDMEIAKKTYCSHQTVIAWRKTRENDLEYTGKPLRTVQKQLGPQTAVTGKVRGNQLKLL